MVDDPIEHVVILMLENQSFDPVVGLTSGVNGPLSEASFLPLKIRNARAARSWLMAAPRSLSQWRQQ
jgi:phospholipase C